MQDTSVSYSFLVNDTRFFIKLLALCVLEFLVLFIVFLWWLFVLWKGGSVGLLVGLSLLIALPISTFYFFRKRSTEKITVLLSAADMEIQWPSKKVVISFADITSYSAGRISQDTYERESVRIRLMNGSRVRLTATSDLCDIIPLKNFRESFDTLAQNLGLKEEPTWEERLLMKK